MLFALLLACFSPGTSSPGTSSPGTSSPDTAALEARIGALEAARVEDQARIEALQHRLEQVDQRLGALEGRSLPSVGSLLDEGGSSPIGPQCTEAEGGWRLPEVDLQPAEVLERARVIPHRGSTGDVDGYRLSGIRRGSTFESCGFRNGDVVHSVNGMSLATAEQALEAYTALRDAPELTVAVTRRGRALEVVLRRS